MKSDTGSKYQAPRAVRLADAATGTFRCENGIMGTQDLCQSGSVANEHFLCQAGSGVQS
jgi:hypothetical protein